MLKFQSVVEVRRVSSAARDSLGDSATEMSSSEDSKSEEESESSSSDDKKKKKKAKKKKDKKKAKKEKKREKKDKKKAKKEKEKAKKRKRSSSSESGKRSPSRSRSRSRSRGRSESRRKSRSRGKIVIKDSRSPSRKRGRSDSRSRSPPPRKRTPPRRHVGADSYYNREAIPMQARSRSRTPPPAPRSPMKMPEGRKMTLAEACEAAGRGMTSGQTAKDDEVQVLGPDEEKVNVERFETFDDVKQFPREIREQLKKAGFPSPSQIQAWTWPLTLKGKDIIGIAATGSGKTLAFLLPAFSQMYDEGHRSDRDGAGLLVMSPTRELAQQTETEANRFGQCIGFYCVAMYGGAPKGNQLSKYRQGCHTIVACPGRLNDFLESGTIHLDHVQKLVLDEADRMLDMGFEPQIRKILARLPRKRHTLFFTATWPREVRKLASEILNRPYKVMIGHRDELKGNQDITQLVRIVDAYSKQREIENLLREAGLTRYDSAGKALVFCNTKRMCEQLANSLSRAGLPCTSIHGDKDQHARDEALSGLKSGRFKVMVATDVAARGLDIKGVGLVVNFDPANNTEDYVHRIGRTGRAGCKGYAVTFMTSADASKARGIVEVMERTNQEISSELRRLVGSAPSGGGGHSRYGPRGGGGSKW